MQNDIEGVAFDLDGTLYPNYQLNMRLIPFFLREGRLLAAFGRARSLMRADQERELRNPPSVPSCPGGGFYDVQARIAARFLAGPDDVIRERIETLIYRGWEPIFKRIRLFPHVRETIAALRQGG
ncbi:MAG: HAD family hydrolase, partial [Treponema sp.]|nr:HAD family hydrolase [Treponema sp.]